MGHYLSEMESEEDYNERQNVYKIRDKVGEIKCNDLTVDELITVLKFMGFECSISSYYTEEVKKILEKLGNP